MYLGNVLKAILDGQIYGGCQIARMTKSPKLDLSKLTII